MKKYCIALLALMFIYSTLQGQEFKFARSTGKLVIKLPSVTVEGYNGSEIVFTSQNKNFRKPPMDEKAKGLESADGIGAYDNTGLGIEFSENGGIMQVNQVSVVDNSIRIMVPKGIRISYISSSNPGRFYRNAGSDSDSLPKSLFRNLETEIEINAQGTNIELINVTGPMTVSSLYGNIDVKCKEPVKGPVSIVAISGYVDMALPVSVKASLDMRSRYGQILMAPEFKMEIEKNDLAGNPVVGYETRGIKGKINGGGISIFLRSDNRKVYLRKL
jgi:hypothetical protein